MWPETAIRPGIGTRWFILLALFCVLLGSCANPEHDALRFGLNSAPVTLDPRFATDATSDRINRLIYQPLVDFDAAMRPVPALASWQQLSPLHYRFILNKQRQAFHNGFVVDARDVKATYDSVLDPATASPGRSSIEMIARVEVINADTVDFYLNRSDPLFPAYLVQGIMPAKLLRQVHPFNKFPVGSGPFKLLEWPEEGRLRLQRVSDGQVLEFLHIADPTVRSLKLIRGEIDMLQNDLPPELVQYLGTQKLTVTKRQGTNFSYLGFNLEDAVTGNRLVRQAIAYALDRPAIIKHVFGGAARPATAIFPPEHWAGNNELVSYPHDPVLARKLLGQAGYDVTHPLHLVYKTSSDPFRIRLATVLQSQMRQSGIDVELRSYDWGTFYGDIKAGRFQLFSLAWIGIRTPDIFRYAFHTTSIPPDGANRGRYSNPQLDALIERTELMTDPQQMVVNYRAIERVLHEDLPYVPLWYEDHVFISRKDIKGYRLSPDGNYDGLISVKRAGS